MITYEIKYDREKDNYVFTKKGVATRVDSRDFEASIERLIKRTLDKRKFWNKILNRN